MSKQFEAKQAALAAYPDDAERAIDLFLQIVDMDQSDIEYEIGQSVYKYLGFPNPNE